MSSNSPSATLSPLITADSNVIKDQQQSFLNPDISGKSLNTKEFSDVLDDQHAQQKVSGGSKISDSVKDQPNRDDHSIKASTTAANQKNTDVDVETGNLLPLSEELLPQEVSSPDSFLLGDNSDFNDGEFTSEWVLAKGNDVSEASSLEKPLSTSSDQDPNNEEVNSQVLLKPTEDKVVPVLATEAKAIKSSPVSNSADQANAVAKAGITTAVEPATSKQAPRVDNAAHANTASSELFDRASGGFNPSSNVLQQSTESSVIANVSSSGASTNPIAGGSGLSLKLQTDGATKGFNDKVKFESLLASAGDSSKSSPKETTLSSSWSMTDASQVYKTAAQSFVSTAAAVPVNKSGFSEAVMQKVMWMSSQQINRAEISLDPPELGSLQVRVSSHGDQTSVVFSSQHGSVRDALDQNLPRLREMLEQQGLNLADVNVAHQGAEQQQRSDSDSSSSVADSRASNQLDDNVEQLDSKPVESLPKTLSLVDHYV